MLNSHFYYEDDAQPGLDDIVGDKPHGLPRSTGEMNHLSLPVVSDEGEPVVRALPQGSVDSGIVRRSKVVFDPSNRPRKRSRRS